MNNMLKTIFVVSVMGGALYGAYVLLNENEFRSRQAAVEAEGSDDLQISFGEPTGEWPSDSEPGPVEFPEEGVPSTPPSFPSERAAPPASVPEGMTEASAADVVRSLGSSNSFGGSSFPSNSPAIGDTTPSGELGSSTPIGDPSGSTAIGEAAPNATPVDDRAFRTADPLAANAGEPDDLTMPPDLAPTPGAGSGAYALPDAEFQSFEGGVSPVPGDFDDPGFDEGPEQSLADSSASGPAFDEIPGVSATGATATGTTEVAIEAARQMYLRTIETAKAHVAQQNYRDALAALSVVYGNPDLPSPEREELSDLLDALAAKVIYSAEHLHQPPYVVQAGDTFESIASLYSITPEFLAKINGIEILGVPPEVGSTLKVVRGPFRAEVRLPSDRGSLTLYLGELYAGRFEIEAGQDNLPFPGKYAVRDKAIGRQFMTTEGAMIPGDSPENPYGGYWIDLGSGVSLHGSPATPTPGGRLGCMAVAGEGQASDLFVILSNASTVDVRR